MKNKNQAYDIIILAGQSNSEGCGRGPVTLEYVPDADVMYLYQNYKIEITTVDGKEYLNVNITDPTLYIDVADEREDETGKIGDLSLTFAKEYKAQGYLDSGRKILIVRAGVGGTGFKKRHWGLSDELYLRMLGMVDHALSLNRENRIAAFLWHQGEHDAFEETPPEIFERQLTDMIKDVKKRYNVPTLPFITGDFVNEWKSENIGKCAPIVEKIRTVTEREGGTFVETADLPSNNQRMGGGDNIHFCRESLHILGRRYFEAYKNLLNKK